MLCKKIKDQPFYTLPGQDTNYIDLAISSKLNMLCKKIKDQPFYTLPGQDTNLSTLLFPLNETCCVLNLSSQS